MLLPVSVTDCINVVQSAYRAYQKIKAVGEDIKHAGRTLGFTEAYLSSLQDILGDASHILVFSPLESVMLQRMKETTRIARKIRTILRAYGGTKRSSLYKAYFATTCAGTLKQLCVEMDLIRVQLDQGLGALRSKVEISRAIQAKPARKIHSTSLEKATSSLPTTSTNPLSGDTCLDTSATSLNRARSLARTTQKNSTLEARAMTYPQANPAPGLYRKAGSNDLRLTRSARSSGQPTTPSQQLRLSDHPATVSTPFSGRPTILPILPQQYSLSQSQIRDEIQALKWEKDLLMVARKEIRKQA